MLLSDDKKQFLILINNASQTLKISPSFIEKDFYSISILKELISLNPNFVFKGGTSLSVCQKCINRFSEDIDISYVKEHLTQSKSKRVKQAFIESINKLGLTISNIDDIRSRRVFNRYICPYESNFNFQTDQILVEWAIQTPSFPIEIKEAQTIIGRYLTQIGRLDLVKQYSLEAFNVNTITKERTLVDKTFAICDYHISKKIRRQSRHIYDIYCLIPFVELNDNLLELFEEVKKYRIINLICYSVRGDKKIHELLKELISEETYRDDYEQLTFPLVYDRLTYDQCIEAISKLSKFLQVHNF